MVSQKDLEQKAAKLAEKATHAATSYKFLAVIGALLAAIVGYAVTDPSGFKAKVAPIYTKLVDGQNFDLPEGFPKFDIFKDEENVTSIGKRLRDEGLRPQYPFLIVPGFVTSGLELWRGEDCARKFFRKRMWAGGNFGMAQTLFSNVDCWLRHMSLDPVTGRDPKGIHLRSAQGLEAVDYFVPGYAVWAKLVEALADLGYDSNTLSTVTYDWRLAVPNLEIRDSFFTRLKIAIEQSRLVHKKKVIVATHSWGDNVCRAFYMWIDSLDENWVENNIETYINLAGPILGVPKSLPAFLSGETRDTADMGLMSTFLGEKMVPAKRRAALFRTWGAGIGMLPVGGKAIWGNTTWAPDDTEDMRKDGSTFGSMMNVVDVSEEAAEKIRQSRFSLPKFITKWLESKQDSSQEPNVTTHDVSGAVDVLMNYAGKQFKKQSEAWSAALPNNNKCTPLDGTNELTYYHDPLKCPLPKAPNMKLYCLYGIGKPCERSYHYMHTPGPKAQEEQDKNSDADDDRSEWHINTEMGIDGWTNGVKLGDGDGTVPLISTGLLCHKGWRDERLNPGGIRVRQREYAHQPVSSFRDIRGGPRSSDHVDLLGNVDVMEDVLRIAAGQLLEDNITSSLPQIAAQINLPESASAAGYSLF